MKEKKSFERVSTYLQLAVAGAVGWITAAMEPAPAGWWFVGRGIAFAAAAAFALSLLALWISRRRTRRRLIAPGADWGVWLVTAGGRTRGVLSEEPFLPFAVTVCGTDLVGPVTVERAPPGTIFELGREVYAEGVKQRVERGEEFSGLEWAGVGPNGEVRAKAEAWARWIGPDMGDVVVLGFPETPECRQLPAPSRLGYVGRNRVFEVDHAFVVAEGVYEAVSRFVAQFGIDDDDGREVRIRAVPPGERIEIGWPPDLCPDGLEPEEPGRVVQTAAAWALWWEINGARQTDSGVLCSERWWDL